jgi:hypothetical protein
MQILEFHSSTPRDDGAKYLVTFCSKIGGEDYWFKIVMPVKAHSLNCVRWCSAFQISEFKVRRSHPVTIVKIAKAVIYIGDMQNGAEDNALNLPSEWSPIARQRVQPWVMGQVPAVRGCQRRVVQNLFLTVPRTYETQDPLANRYYFQCQFDVLSPQVIDLTGEDDSDAILDAA